MPPAAESIDEAVLALGWQLSQSPDEAEGTVISSLASGAIMSHDPGMRRPGCKKIAVRSEDDEAFFPHSSVPAPRRRLNLRLLAGREQIRGATASKYVRYVAAGPARVAFGSVLSGTHAAVLQACTTAHRSSPPRMQRRSFCGGNWLRAASDSDRADGCCEDRRRRQRAVNAATVPSRRSRLISSFAGVSVTVHSLHESGVFVTPAT